MTRNNLEIAGRDFSCWHCNQNLLTAPHWYAVSTCSRQEKKTAEQIARKEIVCFLPMQTVERVWKNGQRMLVKFPLFSGYLFVNMRLADKLKVLQTPGVVRLVGSGRTPEPIPEEQIYAVLALVEANLNCSPSAYLRTGQRVEVKRGPLRGLRGILVRRGGHCKLVLSVDLIRQSVTLEVDRDWVEPIQ